MTKNNDDLGTHYICAALHVSAIYLACIFHQGQKGALLTAEEIAACHKEVSDLDALYSPERTMPVDEIIRNLDENILTRWQSKS